MEQAVFRFSAGERSIRGPVVSVWAFKVRANRATVCPNMKARVVALLLPWFASAIFAAENTLTPAEKASGWQLLFDGKSLDGWRPYRKKAGEPIAGWEVKDGTLHCLPKPAAYPSCQLEKFEGRR